MSVRFPCHPLAPAAHHGAGSGWAACPECGTLLRDGPPVEHYDDLYPEQRAHHDPVVGRCKVRSLGRWLRRLQIPVEGEAVCEIGFGGGFCLEWLHRRGSYVMGLEPIQANRAHATKLGIPPDRLYDVDPYPALPRRPRLWLLQDSFEHVPDPERLVRWMAEMSEPERARVVLVAPDGGSLSRRALGRFWLHNVPDHWIHYSRRGVAAIFERHGFRRVRDFAPLKCVSLSMALRHAGVLLGRPMRVPAGALAALSVWFNLGEMGLLFERDADRRKATA